jgi:peptidyl-prolyl cis-trans isomerase D
MFEVLRKMIFPIILIVLLLFVAMIVLQWGREITGRDRFGAPNVAGVVNGEQIPMDAYNRLYENLYRSESEKNNGDLPETRNRELEQQAWQQLVHEYLLKQEAAKHNIVITDDEVYQYLKYSPPAYLQSSPSFQTDGKFDYQKYIGAMADPQASGFWSQLEPGIKSDLVRMKMQEMVIQAVEVTEPEVKEAFLDAQEKVKVGYINVPQRRFGDKIAKPTDDELRKYFEAHKDAYKQEERAVLNIARIEKRPSTLDSANAYATVKAIYDSLQSGADFAEMAKAHSQDNSAASGGEIGAFTQGSMVPEFDKVAFSLKDGELSSPFRTQFGWHIIKHHGYEEVKETKDGKQETVRKAKVSHILIRLETSQNTIDEDYRKLGDFLTAAKEQGFTAAAKEAGLKMETPPPFEKGAPIVGLGFDPTASDFAFNNPANTISEAMENNSSVYVLQVAQRYPAGPSTFEESRNIVKNEVDADKLEKLCADTANVIYGEIKRGVDPKTAAKNHGADFLTSDLFSRTTTYVPELGRDPKAIGTAFSLTTVGQFSEPVAYDAGVVIFQLLERQTPEMTLFNEKRDSVYNAVKMAKQQDMYSKWYEGLVKISKIENNIEKQRRAAATSEPM